MISEELLSLLVCPQCKGPLVMWLLPLDQNEARVGEWLDCHACRRRYPIRDDIPVMLPDEAKQY